ncbi:ATP-binding protein [Cohnella lubricantis]|uniref:histidine kinase n=1 Tax=Cohnella lubricantis TaxID=2163172 RepID=A0A841TI84_9BACL|nr:ATP-binding protein [Cohnella lubricantis]MBB6678657.1 PAS domain S-box protein [Cohnella lubricantis]MBP2119183.1 PAS domain S-box-containing protein [Cohnella lubricantis]
MNGFEGTWPAVFLLLALSISILASYTMFIFIGNLKRSNSTFRNFWLAGGAFVFSAGLWAKHFVAATAFEGAVYFSWSVPVSLFFNIFFSLMAFVMITIPAKFKYQAATGSFILSFGVGFMNYFRLLGQPIKNIRAEPGLIVLSLVLLFMGTYGAIRLFELHGERNKWLASVTLGLSVLCVQLFGMQALDIDYSVYMTMDKLSNDIHQLVLIIGIAALMLLVSTWATWFVDRRMNMTDERYRLVVENSLDTIAIFKQERWAFVNESGLRMFEAEEPGELLGKPIYAFLQAEDFNSVRERLHNLVFTGSSGPLEQVWYTLKGKLLHTEIVETMTTLDNEPAIQVIMRDISERKKNEELLINSEKLYVAGQLAAGIAHEIRNPLTSLKGFLQLIASGRREISYYGIMNSELNRIEGIVSELLMLSKPQVYELSYYDVRSVMRDTVTLLEAQAILHNIAIETDLGRDTLWIYGVENQIKQVFINVIKNAIEAMIDGGAIRIQMGREDDSVRIRISDEGPGIKEAQLAKMGQPFYTTKEKGTGLGLMVSYKIVDNHQGRIDVYSQLGAGTTFEISLPFRYPEAEAVTKSS